MAKSANRRSRSFARRSARKAWWRSGELSSLVASTSSVRVAAKETPPDARRSGTPSPLSGDNSFRWGPPRRRVPAAPCSAVACQMGKCLLARKRRRTNYLQRPRWGRRNVAGRTLGQAAAAAIGELCFSIWYEVLDYEHDQRGGDYG